MTRDAHAEIDWTSAEVDDGALVVTLGGDPSKAWAQRVAEVIERLERPGSDWGAIEVSRKRIRVSAVQPGTEADVRHFLEGAVLQANADFAADEADADANGSDSDREMTAAFRAFDEDADPRDGEAPSR
jgi:hypothetical protein